MTDCKIKKNSSKQTEKLGREIPLIGLKKRANLNDYQALLKNISGFYISASCISKPAKLQLKFKSSIVEIQSGYFHEFSQIPKVAQNSIQALAFLIACLKYHGFCKNEAEYPLLQGEGALEAHVGLYDEQGTFIELGHTYDDELFLSPSSLTTDEATLGDILTINSDFSEITLCDYGDATIDKLTYFLESICDITPLNNSIKRDEPLSPHVMRLR